MRIRVTSALVTAVSILALSCWAPNSRIQQWHDTPYNTVGPFGSSILLVLHPLWLVPLCLLTSKEFGQYPLSVLATNTVLVILQEEVSPRDMVSTTKDSLGESDFWPVTEFINATKRNTWNAPLGNPISELPCPEEREPCVSGPVTGEWASNGITFSNMKEQRRKQARKCMSYNHIRLS